MSICQNSLQPKFKLPPIDETGQRIVCSPESKLPGHMPLGRHVVKDKNRTQNIPRGVSNGGGGVFDSGFRSIA